VQEPRRARRWLVVGATPEARRSCASLVAEGDDVVHLAAPTDSELAHALGSPTDGVAVLLHDDTQALRYCLAAEHLSPGLPMVVALFDKTAASQLVSVIPHCRVTSPAEVALPSLVAAALSDGLAGVVDDGKGWTGYRASDAGAIPFEVPRSTRWRSRLGIVAGQLRPHDSGSLILLTGLAGILLLLMVDTVAGLAVLHETPIGAFHAAVRTVATVGPVPVEEDHPGYLLFAALAMLATIGLTAMFTAGIVEHLLSGRLIAIWGRRVLPRRGHVVVVGMGQVGLRLAEEIRRHGLGVIGIERYPTAPHLRTARSLDIPVLVGDGSRRRILARARADHAVALCAVASDELDNVAVAVTARAVSPDLRVVMRAGNHDAIAETQSLFRIGTVVDTAGLTAAYVVRCLTDARPRVVLSVGSGPVVVDRASGRSEPMTNPGDCPH